MEESGELSASATGGMPPFFLSARCIFISVFRTGGFASGDVGAHEKQCNVIMHDDTTIRQNEYSVSSHASRKLGSIGALAVSGACDVRFGFITSLCLFVASVYQASHNDIHG